MPDDTREFREELTAARERAAPLDADGADLHRYRQELRIGDLEKQLTLRDAEIGNLKQLLRALMAERAECSTGGAPDGARVAQLHAELERSRDQAERLRQAMESSLALKLARSFSVVLAPLRGWLGKGAR